MWKLLCRLAIPFRLAFALFVSLQVTACGAPEERAQTYYENGMKLLAAHDDQKAAIEFRNALRLKRDLLPAWRGLAQTEEATHDWEGLAAVLQTVLKLDPGDEATRLKLAKLLLAGNAVDMSLKLLNDAAPDTNDPKLLALKAVILYKMKDNDAAIRNAQAALRIDSHNTDALIVLATDRVAKNDPKGALELLSSNSSTQTENVGVQLTKIKIYEQLGNLSQVEALLRSLTNHYPQEIAFRNQLIKFYIDQHRQDDAENELRTIVAADPKNSEAELELVRLEYAIKGAAAARRELVARIGAGGDIFPYQMALAEFDYAQGDFTDSDKLLETLVSDNSSPEHALAAKIKLAEAYVSRKNLDAADVLVSEILRDDSLRSWKYRSNALKLRASIAIDRGRPGSAISDLRQALSDKPRSTELMLLLATAYERSGAMELAEKQFADALRVSDFAPAVGLDYSAFLRRRGSNQRAEDVLADLARRQPNNIAVLSELAEVKLARQDWVGAQEIGETIRRIGTSTGVADRVLGAALSGQRKYDESIAAFQDAVRKAPSTMQPMVSLVAALLQAKQTDRAISFLQAVLKSNPENADAYVLLGLIARANRLPDEAKRNFTAAIEKNPKDSFGYRALADLYLSQKDTDAALRIIQAGLKLQPDNVTLHMTLAGVLEQTENYAAAIAEYEYILAQQPGSLIATNNLASLLADHRTDVAGLERAQALAASLRLSPVPQFKDTLGWVTYRRGNFHAAIPLLEEAAAALPDSALVLYHLGMSYKAAGQEENASGEFKAALTKAANSKLKETIAAELTKMAVQ